MNWDKIYKLPLHQAKYGTWVYDTNSNFVFQFENIKPDQRLKYVALLNGVDTDLNIMEVSMGEGEIFVNGQLVITIRGWGNLTGIGAHNLSGEDAAQIQDTFAEWIVEQFKNKMNEQPIEKNFLINKWEIILSQDADKDITYGRKVLLEMLNDFKSLQPKEQVNQESVKLPLSGESKLSAEEVLKKLDPIFYEESLGSMDTAYKRDDVIQAMHDFANNSEAMKQHAIGFAEWVFSNGFYRNAAKTNLLWVTEDNTYYSGCAYTGDELLTEYLTNKENESKS